MGAGTDWLSVLVQVPLVAVFIYFALQQQKQFNLYLERREEAWRDFLKEERDALVRALDALTDEVRAVRDHLQQHDTRMVALLERGRE